MAITLNGDSGITTPTYGGSDTSEYLVPVTAFKNRIINGSMQIDQRNAGASVTPTDAQYTLDRWGFGVSAASKFTAQQNAAAVTPPVGFTNYIGITSSSAYSVVAGDYFNLNQPIEGFNVADLGWGTANAATVTLSFWVRSSLTGTFGGSLRNNNGTRSYPYSYTISSANTWELKTITVAGDTSGTWVTTNGIGLRVSFGFGVGSTFSGTAGAWASANFASSTGATSVVGTNGATFYITGVQLEKGSTATSFDYRPYGQELALCQRYFINYGGDYALQILGSGQATTTTATFTATYLPVTMRTQPSISFSGVSAADGVNAVTNLTNLTVNTSVTSEKVLALAGTVASGLTQYRPYYIRTTSTSGYLQASAEL